MVIAISDMVARSAEDLEDSGYTRWSQAKWIDYFNSAIKEVCRFKTDAYVVRGNVTLVDGNIQSLPDRGYHLIRPVRNMGGGTVPGKGIRYTSLDAQSDFDVDWYEQENAIEVDDVFYDSRHPTEFWVSPPAPAYVIEIIYAATPAAVTLTDNFPLLDIYEMPAIYFAKAYAHQANRNDVDMAKANAFFELGFSSLGVQEGNEEVAKNG